MDEGGEREETEYRREEMVAGTVTGVGLLSLETRGAVVEGPAGSVAIAVVVVGEPVAGVCKVVVAAVVVVP